MPGLCWYGYHASATSAVQGLILPALMLLMYFSVWNSRLWLGLLLLTPFAALAPLEAAFIAIYGHPSGEQIIATIAESDLREVVDYLGSAVVPLLSLIGLTFFAAFGTAIAAKRSGLAWRGKWRMYVLAGTLIFPFVAYIAAFTSADGSLTARGETAYAEIAGWRKLLEGSFPFELPMNLIAYQRNWREMREQATRLRNFHFGTYPPSYKGQRREIYVLVIGESSRRNHWSLFGYDRPTTPELGATANLVPFENMASPWSASRMAIPVLLSRKPSTDRREFFDEASIVRAFSEAGFKTYWLSNQHAVGKHDSPISIYAYEADNVRFFNLANWADSGTYDEVLLAPLKAAIEDSADNLFIIMHTMGSHARYEYRYPEPFDIFKPSMKHKGDDAHHISLLNTYDNSIRYTDHFLAATINVLRETSGITALYYTSDHGEDIPNDKCEMFGHGNYTRSNFMIPAFFWYSEAYAETYPSRTENVRRNGKLSMSTENVFESLIDLAGLDFPGHDKSKSFFSETFTTRPRLVNSFQVVDINRAFFTKKCELVVPNAEPGRTLNTAPWP